MCTLPPHPPATESPLNFTDLNTRSQIKANSRDAPWFNYHLWAEWKWIWYDCVLLNHSIQTHSIPLQVYKSVQTGSWGSPMLKESVLILFIREMWIQDYLIIPIKREILFFNCQLLAQTNRAGGGLIFLLFLQSSNCCWKQLCQFLTSRLLEISRRLEAGLHVVNGGPAVQASTPSHALALSHFISVSLLN